jgi:hypothetical protein
MNFDKVNKSTYLFICVIVSQQTRQRGYVERKKNKHNIKKNQSVWAR